MKKSEDNECLMGIYILYEFFPNFFSLSTNSTFCTTDKEWVVGCEGYSSSGYLTEPLHPSVFNMLVISGFSFSRKKRISTMCFVRLLLRTFLFLFNENSFMLSKDKVFQCFNYISHCLLKDRPNIFELSFDD